MYKSLSNGKSNFIDKIF
jgi:3-methylcrotonyl-CoA carboxylase beta subunit